jgi:hypothetical protein
MSGDDIRAIERLKARYFRHIDTKDWEGLRQDVLTPDVRVDVTDDGAGIVEGADRFLAALARVLGGASTIHHGHMPEIELTSATTATGTWAMEDRLRFPEGPVAELHGWGHYHDRYVKTPDGWRIAATRLSRLRLDVVEREPDG